jgi:hypothetical protein
MIALCRNFLKSCFVTICFICRRSKREREGESGVVFNYFGKSISNTRIENAFPPVTLFYNILLVITLVFPIVTKQLKQTPWSRDLEVG